MLTSIELFAGAGGLAMGMTRAGFHHRAVVEWNHAACETIRRNQALGCPDVADWPLHEGDVRDLDYRALAGQIDVVAGGPPCQPFSLGGRHRGSGDTRDMFPAMADVIRVVRPRAFIVENVKGLTRPGFSEYFDYILARLANPGDVRKADEAWADHLRRLRTQTAPDYIVSFRLLNAADYGVPQTRERVFIAGFRRDLGIEWTPPPPTHSRAARSSGTQAWVTVREALSDLPDPQTPHGIPNHQFQPGVKFYPGHTGSPLDRPAKTLKAGDHGVPGGENALIRPDGTGRYFTVREAARLQTFPDSYVFPGSWGEAMRQLGNAVPVALAQAVAASVAQEITASRTAALAG